MRLGELVQSAGLADSGLLLGLAGDDTVDVLSVVIDSRRIGDGSMFACVPGSLVDGHAYAAEAVAGGAVAILSERRLDIDVSQVIVHSVRRTLGPLSDVLWGRPSSRLTIAGVTGTNGKTTTCAMLKEIFDANGWPAAAVGTLSQARTTPEAPELQALLAEWERSGGRAVAMEVSSHALEQHRCDSIRFAAGVFLNLTPEHLDYHGDMSSYFNAKSRLFETERPGVSVVNSDDIWGRRLSESLRERGSHVVTFSIDDATEIDFTPTGSNFVWEGQRTRIALGGQFNVMNALAAATCARSLGIGVEAIVEGLSALRKVPGRFELVDAGQPFTVIVDYAHTPDGLTSVLTAARQICEGRLIVAFGAGGDRDRTKRPLMGFAASQLADLLIVTSDNPRSEDPEIIVSDVLAGVSDAGGSALSQVDRAEAIATALATAQAGDVVVIAGKGHEKYQEVAGRFAAFDDVSVAQEALNRILTARQGQP